MEMKEQSNVLQLFRLLHPVRRIRRQVTTRASSRKVGKKVKRVRTRTVQSCEKQPLLSVYSFSLLSFSEGRVYMEEVYLDQKRWVTTYNIEVDLHGMVA